MKVAYIISMKNGIPPFIYSELEYLEQNGISFRIFPTKCNKGMCDPKDEWEIYRFSIIKIALKQFLYLLTKPVLWVKLFFEAIFTNSLVEFLIATDIASEMKDIDRIHCHFGDTKFIIGYYCKKIINKPLSVTIHAHSLYRNKWKIFKRALDYCDKIVSISEYNKSILMNKFGINADKIIVNHMFVDTEKLKYKKKIKILIAAFFHKKKGHEILFRAIKKLNRDDIELWVVGNKVEGYADIDLEGLAKKIGIEDKVCFFGQQTGNALRMFFNECDIFCLPSVTVEGGEGEGIPVSLMEAMSYEKPVISTIHKGIPELVKEELVKEKDVDGLVKALRKLIENSELRRKQGKKNRKIVVERYSKKNIENLISIFKDEI